jgi:hypothetical protein
MLGFLAPAALLGLALLAIPILLHIFKPRKVRQTPFSSLRWLRASQHRLSRRIKWHQVLLFLLRAGLVTCLVLALAKPILSWNATGGQAERFVIVDVSRTMDYQPQDGSKPLDVAKRVTGQVVSNVVAGDRSTVILAGSKPRAMGPLKSDSTSYLSRIEPMPAELSSTKLTDALRLVQPMIGETRDDTFVDLVFITDNNAAAWSQADVTRFLSEVNQKVSVQVIDVSAPQPDNSWVADARLIETRIPLRRYIRVQVGAVGHEAERRTVQLTGLGGLPPQDKQIQLKPGSFVEVDFELPTEYDLKGKVARIALDPADQLASDDVSWVNLDSTGATNVLLIEGEGTAIAELQAGYHLRTALDVLSGPQYGNLKVTRRPATAVLSEQLAEADVVFMLDVPELSDGNVAALEAAVQRGAGLVVYLGPSANPTFYNTKLHDPLRPSAELSPVTIGDAVRLNRDENVIARLADVDWNHPLFARMLDPIYGDLAQTRFDAYHRMQIGDSRKDASIIATINGEAPALVEHHLGAGRVLIFNTTANDLWSDLPRRKSYLPLLDRMLRYLSGGPRRGTFVVGDVVTMPLPLEAADATVTVTTPDAQTLQPMLRDAGTRRMMQVDDLRMPGIYTVNYVGPEGSDVEGQFPFVVLPSTSDSGFTLADPEALKAWWAPAEFSMVRPDTATGRINVASTRWYLEPWLVFIACLCLLAEMFFVHWLCPKVNPAVTGHSSVAAHGFFRGGMPGGGVGGDKNNSSTAAQAGTAG